MLRHLVWFGSVPSWPRLGKNISFLPQPILPELSLLLVKFPSSSWQFST